MSIGLDIGHFKSKVVSCRKNMIFVEGSIENENKILIAESKGIWFIKR